MGGADYFNKLKRDFEHAFRGAFFAPTPNGARAKNRAIRCKSSQTA
jgi:hypothetical protein